MSFKTYFKASLLLAIAGSMMGNTSCQSSAPAARELRRRVQRDTITAFQIQLPNNGGSFDFQGAANAQIEGVFSDSQSFSSALSTTDQTTYNLSGLSEEAVTQFNQCQYDPTVTSKLAVMNAQALQATTNGGTSETAACMIDMPQGVVGGKILDFSLTNQDGLSLSLAQLPSLPVGIGATFNFTQYDLNMSMWVEDPLVPGGGATGHNVLAQTSTDSFQDQYGGSLNVSYLGITGGVSGYTSTPLSHVVLKGLTTAVTDLATQWDADGSQPWYAMVISNCDQFIMINSGADANLKQGDIVAIWNVAYTWSGPACNSTLKGALQDPSGLPVAYATISEVGATTSFANVFKNNPTYPYSTSQIIQPGARVYMQVMATPTPAPTPAQ